MHSEVSVERPLTPWARTGLIVATSAVIVVFYAFALVAAFTLLLVLAGELLLVLALLRFGLAGWMIRVMDAHVRVVGILLRSLWLPAGTAQFHIPLREPDAPELFRRLRSLSERIQVRPPDDVQLEMSVNAWVNLKGFRSGAGTTRLGIGYDLLCGLTMSEFEAVLAHELAHAKLIQRGFNRAANSALGRCAALVNRLSAHVREGRDLRQERALACSLLAPADALIRILARLVAACSRQHEFEADRLAAEISGPNALRSSLLKLDPLNEASSRLPWRERVARLQSGQGFSEWFAKELAVNLASARQPTAHVFDKYSTHPALPDRLGALPPDTAQESDDSPALSLLAAPDAIAERLVEEIQRVCALEEAKDSKALSKWTRRANRGSAVRGLQALGLLLFILALVL